MRIRSGFLDYALYLFILVLPISSFSFGGGLKVIYLAFLFILLGILNYKGITRSNSKKVELAVSLLILSSVYALILGVLFKGGSKTFTEFLGILFSFILIIILNRVIHDIHTVDKLVKIFLISIVISDIVVLFLLLRGNPMVFAVSQEGIRLVGFFSNPNFLAASHLLVIPYAIYGIINSKNKIPRFLFILSLFILMLVLIMAQSRSAFLGLIIALIIVFFKYKYLNTKLILKAVFLLLIFIVSGLYILQKNDIKLARFSSVLSSGSVSVYNVNESAISKDRGYLLKNGLVTIFNYPLGLGYSEQYKIMGRLTGIYKISHNANIQLIITYGLFFGLFWNLILIYLLYDGYKKIKVKRLSSRNLAPYLFVGYFSYFIYDLGHDSSNWVYYWIYAYLLFLIVRLEHSNNIDYNNPVKSYS